MGKGKKKGKKEPEDVPSVAGLSISEDTPSTSQLASPPKPETSSESSKAQPSGGGSEAKAESKPAPKAEPEEEDGGGLGLGGGGAKRKRKKKSLAASEAAAKSESKTQADPAAGRAAPQPTPIPTPQVQKTEPPIAQAGGDHGPRPQQVSPGQGWGQPQGGQGRGQPPFGQGRGQPPFGQGRGQQQAGSGRGQPQAGSGRGQPQAYPGQPQPQAYPGQPQPQAYPGQPQPQAYPGQPQPQAYPGQPQPQAYPGQPQPQAYPGQPQPQAYPGQPQPQAYPGQPQPQAYPGQPQPQAYPGQPQPQGQARRQAPPQSHPGQGQPSQEGPSRPTPTRDVVLTPSMKELTCRYKIPAKIIGRSVQSTPIKVMTNYFPMNFKAIKVYRYDVTMKPDRPKKMLTAVFKKVKETYYPRDLIAFDQAKNCYCLQPLKNVPSNGDRYTVETQITDNNGKIMPFQVAFKATGVVDLGKIKDHMDGHGSSLNTPSEEIQCIDVILRQGALEAYVKCGRQFFKRPENPVQLSGGLEMWTGLFQSAIFTSRGFVNIDVAHKGFPIKQSLVTALTNSFRLEVNRPVEEQRSREVDNFLNFVKGLRVVVHMMGPPYNGQTREYISNGLVEPPFKKFFTFERDGKSQSMSVGDYFTKDRGYRIQYPNLNCVWVGPRDKKIYYPMELVDVAYGQALNRQLNEMQLANIVKEAATPPYERKRKIDEATRAMNYSSNDFFKKFGLEISDKFLEVEAKILAPPSLNVGDARPLVPRRGVWQTNRLVKPQPLESWGFIAIDSDPRACNFDGIKDLLLSTGRQMGMEVKPPRLMRFNVRMNELRAILLGAVDEDIRFLFIVVSPRAKDTYHRVKQLAESDVGILTQCIREQTAARRMNPQTMKNILLKVNSKLMGINQVLDVRATPACLQGGGVMVVGADVTHPSPDQTSIPSIAAVTASLDDKCFIYNIELSIQTPKKEMIVEFGEMMLDHLRLYRERNRALPRKIYVFRDGVSEGQFAQVMNSELTAIHSAYQALSQSQKPEVLFLLVQKRHHTRFFTIPRCDNVEPGTVVDTHIVHPKELDFYLVSHQAIKGTARPTRYHGVCNDSHIPHDEVEQLTYYLCHLYARCMRAVSYPTPTYYAHLACLRARSLTHGKTFDNQALEKKPQRLRVLDKMLRYSRMFFV